MSDTPLLDATDKAIDQATHLKDAPQYAGAVEAIRALARKIDAWDVIVQWAIEDATERDTRPSVPANDNVSLASYLKYAEALGLTPAAQNAIPNKGKAADQPKKRGGSLAAVSSIPRPTGS